MTRVCERGRVPAGAGFAGAVCVALAACGALAPAPGHTRPELVEAVVRGDAAAARRLLARGADPNARGDHGDTPLMLAVLYGDADLVGVLLARGADPRLANAAGTTALHWALDDAAKTDALLAAGADPGARGQSGYTPLMLAALRDGGEPIVARLLAHGARPDDANEQGTRAIILAAGADAASLETLLAHGAAAGARTAAGSTALHAAAAKGNLASVRRLLDEGVDVNARTAEGRTPLMWAAQMGAGEVVATLLAHGANPNLQETFSGTTALIQAAASDRADDALVETLIAAGAELEPADDEGGRAAMWAGRRGDPSVVAVFRAHGSPPTAPAQPAVRRVGPSNTVAQALRRAVPLLERAGPAFRAEALCPSCHHHALPAMAIARARERGVAVDEEVRAREARATVDALRPGRERFLQGVGFADVVEPAYLLVGLAASGYPRDDMTDAMARYLALRQTRTGGWRAIMQRMPMDGSDVAFTAMAIRALSVYGPPSRADIRAQIARARGYLRSVEAHTTEDLTFQALGLAWSGASTRDVAPVIAQLAARQRSDGGFAQRGALASDAYATGQAIVALHDAGGLRGDAPVIQRAVRSLLANQCADGSWFVATRALRFQPMFDSGFPGGRSQFISAGATAWATMALAAVADERLAPAPAL